MKSSKNPGAGTRHLDIWLMAGIAIALVAATIFVSLKLLDQSERHVEAVKEMKVTENVDNTWAPQAAQCNTMVKRDLEEDPNRVEAQYSDIQISETSMLYIAKMSKLRSLALSGCNIGDRWLKHLEPLQLEEINLGDCDITDDALKELVKIKTLRAVQLNGCTKIGDRGLEIITQLPLVELYMSKTKISDDGIKFLTACKSLQRLDLSATKITSSGLSKIADLSQLLTLDASDLQIQAEVAPEFQASN